VKLHGLLKTIARKFQNKTARVAVMGMGYVGLPFCHRFAEAGFTVVGVDPVKEKMEKINHGESYIMDVPTAKWQLLVNRANLPAPLITPYWPR